MTGKAKDGHPSQLLFKRAEQSKTSPARMVRSGEKSKLKAEMQNNPSNFLIIGDGERTYEAGYRDGFKDGFEAAQGNKKTIQRKPKVEISMKSQKRFLTKKDFQLYLERERYFKYMESFIL